MSMIHYLQKLISTFYKDDSDKSTATSSPMNTVLSMTKPTKALAIKQKRSWPTKASSTDKYTKKN